MQDQLKKYPNESEMELLKIRSSKETRSEIEKNIGNLFFKANNFDSAISYYTKSISLMPTFAVAYCNRGYAIMMKEQQNIHFTQFRGQLALALSDVSRAIQFDPHYAKAYHRRATIHGQLGNYRLAISDFENLQRETVGPIHADVLKEIEAVRRKLRDEVLTKTVMPMCSAVNRLKKNPAIITKLALPEVQEIFRSIKQNPNLVIEYLKQEDKRNIILEIMKEIVPSFPDRLKKEEQSILNQQY